LAGWQDFLQLHKEEHSKMIETENLWNTSNKRQLKLRQSKHKQQKLKKWSWKKRCLLLPNMQGRRPHPMAT